MTDSNQIEAQGADAIADSVFRNYAVLASVMLPANLATIGLDAFARCGALETLTFQSITVPELEMITGLDTENNPVPVTDNRFTMTESDVTVTAVFAAIPTYFVTVAGLVYEDGTREAIRKSVAGTNSITIPLSGFATVEIVDERREFADVPTDSWYSDAVAFVSAQELFDGTSAQPPSASTTRAHPMTVLARLDGVDVSGANSLQKGRLGGGERHPQRHIPRHAGFLWHRHPLPDSRDPDALDKVE